MRTAIKHVLLFVAGTYAVSGASIALYLGWGGAWRPPWSIVVMGGYMCIPGLVALLVQRFVAREAIAGPLGIRFRPHVWWLGAWLAPVAFAYLAFGISLLWPGAVLDPGLSDFFRSLGVLTPAQLAEAEAQARSVPLTHIFLYLTGAGLLAGATINALFGLGEELGWRGFLPRYLAPLGFWRASLLIGGVWGLWHAPIILLGHNYPQHPTAGVAMMTLFTVLFTPLILYVRLRSRSVIAAAIMHGTFNGVAGLSVIAVSGVSDLVRGTVGVAGCLLYLVLDVLLLRYLRTRPDPLHAARFE